MPDILLVIVIFDKLLQLFDVVDRTQVALNVGWRFEVF